MQNLDFFNRKEYLEILDKRIKAIKEGYRQNIAIIGDKDIGKSSLILHFLNHFNDPMILPVYIELRQELTKELFARKFIGVLIYNFLENSNIDRNENIDFLLLKAARFIPRTVGTIRTILNSLTTKAPKNKSKENILLTQLLLLCDILFSETGKRCVVIFDEFHHLGSLGFNQPYIEFSKILMIQKNVLYVIVSSAKHKAKKILSSNLSLLFGNFEVVEIPHFDLKDTEEFLKTRLSHIEIRKCLIDFLIHFTGGLPLYLNIFSDYIARISNPITKDTLTEIIQNLLFVEQGILNQRFNNYLTCIENLKATEDYQTLLFLIADGKNRARDMAASLHKSKSQILSRLNLLIEYDIISKSGDFFAINDRIFAFWLRFVYKEKTNSLIFNIEKQKENFRIKIENMINQFILANRKSVLERTMELLRLFENESIQMRTKRIRLQQFQEIKILSFNHSRLNEGLLGRSKDSLWIMAIKSENLIEEDIVEFSKQCRRLRYVKPQKKVIITNSNIDANVRLKAMEERVLTWDLNDLNLILDLYNEPRVIPKQV